MQDLFHLFSRLLMVFLVASMVAVSARRMDDNTLPENSQLIADPETNQIDSGLKQLQIELLAQRLAEMNSPIGFQRDLRSETERKRRFRACYFNPVSCFKK
ncbi:unnamed protein product [Phaedon cochleariae]|uniref:Allatostatin C n=1 Tax=Phaedon cochleariae TaxID=80249 RepID=A0A9N9S8H9_PHACE|nr:unnamed protein product [Phaedon cochleariae]